MGNKWIDWDSQPLGETIDRTLAETLGRSKSSVTAARIRRGIPRYKKYIDWDSRPLGETHDTVLAETFRASTTSVRRARVSRGIRCYVKRIDWDRQPLGEIADAAIAETLGVHVSAVCRTRAKRGIPVAILTHNCPVCLCAFDTDRIEAKYCSPRCRNAAKYALIQGDASLAPAVLAMSDLKRDLKNHKTGTKSQQTKEKDNE